MFLFLTTNCCFVLIALISFILTFYLLFRVNFLYSEVIFPPIRVNLSRVNFKYLKISYNKVSRNLSVDNRQNSSSLGSLGRILRLLALCSCPVSPVALSEDLIYWKKHENSVKKRKKDADENQAKTLKARAPLRVSIFLIGSCVSLLTYEILGSFLIRRCQWWCKMVKFAVLFLAVVAVLSYDVASVQGEDGKGVICTAECILEDFN